MSKLKTLNDLKTVADLLWKVKAPLESGKMETLNHFVRIQELKAEAIKGVKVGMTLREFCNITSEDLK